ncbi:guanine deaminase [Escherichia coli DEC5B]|nr:guanine deaminase [Escherichia coli DEC5B]
MGATLSYLLRFGDTPEHLFRSGRLSGLQQAVMEKFWIYQQENFGKIILLIRW